MATFVVDASVAIKWFVLEADSDKALDLISPDHKLIAKLLMPASVVLPAASERGNVRQLGRVDHADR